MLAKRKIRVLLLLASTAVPCAGTAVEPPSGVEGSLARASTLCGSEFDDPATPEYQACTAAIEALESYLESDPTNARILAALVEAEAGRDPQRALQHAERLLGVEPDHPTANLFVGTSAEAPERRVDHLMRASKSAPDHPRLHGELAVALLEIGDVALALAEVKRQLAVNPDDLGILRRLVSVAESQGREAVAEEILSAYLAVDLPRGQRCRAFAALAGDRLSTNEALTGGFIDACGEEAYFELALHTVAMAERADLLARAIERRPDHPEAHGELALTVVTQGDATRATAEMLHQIALNAPAAGRMLPGLVEALREGGRRFEEAEVLASYLRSSASTEAKCRVVEAIGRERYVSWPEVWTLIERTCGEGVGPGRMT